MQRKNNRPKKSPKLFLRVRDALIDFSLFFPAKLLKQRQHSPNVFLIEDTNPGHPAYSPVTKPSSVFQHSTPTFHAYQPPIEGNAERCANILTNATHSYPPHRLKQFPVPHNILTISEQ